MEPQAQAASRAAHEKIMASIRPPEKLAEVVEAGSLASMLAPAAWEPLRAARQMLSQKQAEHAEVSGALSRVEQELYEAEARVPRNVAALAEAYLKGAQPPEAAPRPGLDRTHLTGVRDGLRQKRQEADAVVKHAESMAYFDKVKITSYPRIRTQAALVWLQQHMPERLAVLECGHVPLTTRGPGGSCIRRLAPAYVNGRLHPCCWVPGFADAETIPLTDDWRERIAQVRAPCDRCMFSEAS